MTASEEALGIAVGHQQLLSASWLLRLAQESGYDLPQISLSVQPFIIGRPDGFHIDVTMTDDAPWIAATASSLGEHTRIDELVKQSGDRTAEGDFGGLVWYSTTLVGQQSLTLDARFMTRLQEILGSQVRIEGWRRLGSHVLLNFREELRSSHPAGA